MKIDVFDNAYGIKGMTVSRTVDRQPSTSISNSCIYAANGIFKSSFSKAIYEMTQGRGTEISDRINDNQVEIDITVSDVPFTHTDKLENVIVYSKELYNDQELSSNEIRQMLLLPEGQKKYSELTKSVSELYKSIENKIKDIKIDKIKNFENIQTELSISSTSELDILMELFDKVIETEPVDTSFIEFSRFGQVAYQKINDKKFTEKASNYLTIRQRKIVSEFFDGNFNDLNYSQLMDILNNVQFLSENRKIVVGEKSFTNFEEFNEYVNKQLEGINTNPEVMASFEELEKALGKAKGAQDIKQYLTNPAYIETLALGKPQILLAKIKKELGEEISEKKLDELKIIKKNIGIIIEQSKNQITNFEKAIKIYELRFKPVFKLTIGNKDSTKVGLGVPIIKFKHEDSLSKTFNESELHELLSSGERNALKILNLIVQYENIQNKDKAIIILDDIVETFDYGNRTAFLEYLKDIQNHKSKLVILTHNFDFFRLVTSRLSSIAGLSAFKNAEGIVEIAQNNNIIIDNKNLTKISEPWELIALVPFAREIIELKEGRSDDWQFLTKLLHCKENTKNIEMSKTLEVINRHLTTTGNYEPEGKYFDHLMNIAFEEVHQFELKKKLAISIKIRLLLEDKIINDDYSRIESINKNQTSELYKLYKQEFSELGLKLYERVQLLTPEYIHFNSFMYEPLVDTCPRALLQLEEELNSSLILS